MAGEEATTLLTATGDRLLEKPGISEKRGQPSRKRDETMVAQLVEKRVSEKLVSDKPAAEKTVDKTAEKTADKAVDKTVGKAVDRVEADKAGVGKDMSKKEASSKKEAANKESAAKEKDGGKRGKVSGESPMEALYRENSSLRSAVQQIEKAFGGGAIMPLGEDSKLNVEGIPTGSLSLDIALGGKGLPRGRVIEIFGPESSGKTTLALHVIAEAQKGGGIAAFIDAEHAFDP